MSGIEAEIKKALTPRAFAFAMVLNLAIIFVLPYVYVYSGLVPYAQKHYVSNLLQPHFPPGYMMGQTKFLAIPWVFFLLIPVFISSVLPKKLKFSVQEIAFIFAFISSVPQIVWGIGGPGAVTGLGLGTLQSTFAVKNWADNYPRILSPWNISLLQGQISGGAAVPWGDWMMPLLFWTFYFVSLFLFTTFWIAANRRVWVEVEELPFPMATIYTDLIRRTEPAEDGKAKFFHDKFFWAGTLVGFLITAFETLYNIFPNVPAVLIQYDLTPMAYYTGCLYFGLSLVLLGFAFLLPNDVLFTSPIAYILLYMILPPIFTSAGWLKPLAPGYHTHVTFNRWIGKFEGSPQVLTYGYHPLAYGIFFTMTIVPFIVHRKYFIDSLKSLWGKSRLIPKDEAQHEKTIWIGVIVFAVLYIVALMIAEMPIWEAALMWLIVTLWYTGMSRWRAETGQTLGGWDDGVLAHGFSVYPFGQDIANAFPKDPKIINSWIVMGSAVTIEPDSSPGGSSQPGPWHMDSFAVGQRVKASHRDLLIAQVVGLVIGVVITIPLWLWLKYATGTATWVGWTGIGNYNGNFGARLYLEGTCSFAGCMKQGDYAMIAIGVILSILLTFMRSRGGVWSWLSPWAIILTLNAGDCIWVPFLAALAIKLLVTRIGGIKLYERMIIPIGIGLVVGCALWWPIISALYVMRWTGKI